ncbi:MAG: esterase/lipase family protein [Solirubrobacteraceae bacterium]
MHKEDIEAIGELTGTALSATGGLIGEMHESIARRTFEVLGPTASPVRAVHDGLSRAVYKGLQTSLHAVSRGGAAAISLGSDEDSTRLADSQSGARALAVINGLYGDHLHEHGSSLSFAMQIRRGGRAVPVNRESLDVAFPDATARIAVFIHGLFESDESWNCPEATAEDQELQLNFGECLQRELGLTPIYLRHNTGRRVSHSGRELAGLLEDLCDAWPTEVQDVVLVGHSMGGLVARSACHYAELEQRRWAGLVRHVFCLGTPHLGADIEKGVNALGWAFGHLPETRPLRKILNARSVGIKDLRFGAVVDEDWHGHDPDEVLRDRCLEVPFLPSANYYFVSATLSDGPLGTLVGDLLVRTPSATGRGIGNSRVIPFHPDNGRELAGRHHFHLLTDPAVYAQMRDWIDRTPRARRQVPPHRFNPQADVLEFAYRNGIGPPP